LVERWGGGWGVGDREGRHLLKRSHTEEGNLSPASTVEQKINGFGAGNGLLTVTIPLLMVRRG
jgi:hypothetical protein